MRSVPCEWPLSAAVDCPEIGDSGDLLAAKAAAVSLLWNWTGRKFGVCPVSIVPMLDEELIRSTYRGQAEQRVGRAASAVWHPVMVRGEIWNLGVDDSGYRHRTAMRLPPPIHTVTEIRINGGVLDPSAYRVDNANRVVRIDGGRWPARQNYTDPTIEVEYLRGLEVPPAGQVAAAVLACEMAKALASRGDCKLPERIQTITREGVTMGFVDPFDGLERGQTGLWLVDSWVASVTRSPRRPSVLSPDVLGPRRPAN